MSYSTNRITDFSLQNASGSTVFFAEFTGNPSCSYRGPTVRHTWQVDGRSYERLNPRNDGLDVLPDASGFLLCEKVDRVDNLLLLDAYGKERMRLSMPWQLTQRPTPESAKYPSRFIGLTTPWDNPKTGETGKFAVLAWVEFAGDYAFELDWRTGEFLWGYYLERG
jgi:hypothetical protein